MRGRIMADIDRRADQIGNMQEQGMTGLDAHTLQALERGKETCRGEGEVILIQAFQPSTASILHNIERNPI